MPLHACGNQFRNPYEVSVDSYGTIWQSDNDDDGNRGVRINYVMEYGNYGYTDEMTHAGWRSARTNMEDSVPYRHWHLNDPGVIPNLLQTGAGSPTGILVYEGYLLPEKFRGQLIHCDAGPNVVRAYPVKKNGAGYLADTINILKGSRDKWFRPADICTAPDGSLIVADWYDPGVGGHAAGDQTRGRIYRIAPPDSGYHILKQDYTTPAGALRALQNPNLSVRFHAWNSLASMGSRAIPELEKLWTTGTDSRMRARAFWVLVKMHGSNPSKYIGQALNDLNPDIRILALRAARELKSDVAEVVSQLTGDKNPQVKRECAIALRHLSNPEAANLWAILAASHTGNDRWYLEALGIGADRQWDRFFQAYIQQVKDPLQNAASRDIVWRSRTDLALPYLSALAMDKNVPLSERLRYFRAFDFQTGNAKSGYLLKMIRSDSSGDIDVNKLVLHALDINTLKKSPQARKALKDVIVTVRGTREYLDLVTRYEVNTENPHLLELAIEKSGEDIGRDAAGLLLSLGGSHFAIGVLKGKDTARAAALLNALGGVGSKTSIDMVQNIALSPAYSMDLRKLAAGNIGRSWGGEERVLEILKQKKVPKELIPDVVSGVSQAWRGSVRSEAQSYLPGNPTAGKQQMPSMEEIRNLKADPLHGKTVYLNNCSICHRVNNEGFEFGPGLSEIGTKYPKEGLLDAILHPSAGISFGYEGWDLIMKDGTRLSGIISSKTETDIELKLPGGIKKQVKTSELKSIIQMKNSMMPEGLYLNMKNQDLADLLEYLSGLVRH